MKWETYRSKFSYNAYLVGFTPEEVESYLSYAKELFDNHLPILYDQKHLSLLVGFKYEYLLKVSNDPRKFYRKFSIPKKSGGEREISEPLPNLKEIQLWIMKEILYKCRVSRFAKAYVRNRSIRTNARFHVRQPIVVTLDIENFFGSLRKKGVYGFYKSLGYSIPVSLMLTNLCCINGSLPQGAPTSPALSNLLMRKIDNRIAGFSIKNSIRYTRYADDLTFSGDFSPGMIIKFVKNVLRENYLTINEKKIQIRRPHQRQEVTGVVVNQKIQAPRALRRKLRQSVYYIKKHGLPSHLSHTDNMRANHVHHLLGIANFILFLNPKDQEVLSYVDFLRSRLHHNEI